MGWSDGEETMRLAGREERVRPARWEEATDKALLPAVLPPHQ